MEGDPELFGNRGITNALLQQGAGLESQLPHPVGNPQQKARIAQVMQQFPLHLRDDVAGGAVAPLGLKAQRRLAQALVGSAEHILVGHAMADREAAGLLPRQVEVGDGELALVGVELAAGLGLGLGGLRWPGGPVGGGGPAAAGAAGGLSGGGAAGSPAGGGLGRRHGAVAGQIG